MSRPVMDLISDPSETPTLGLLRHGSEGWMSVTGDSLHITKFDYSKIIKQCVVSLTYVVCRSKSKNSRETSNNYPILKGSILPSSRSALLNVSNVLSFW